MIPTARRYLAVIVVMEDVHMAKGRRFCIWYWMVDTGVIGSEKGAFSNTW
jgi:hypothetical protein